MKVYFKNDGTYGQRAVGIPVTSDDHPIGYVCDVTREVVTCEIWDKYIIKEQLLCNILTMEQDIREVGIALQK